MPRKSSDNKNSFTEEEIDRFLTSNDFKRIGKGLDLMEPGLQLSAPKRAKSLEPEDRLTLGICAMAKKIKAKPMQAIKRHLEFYNEFRIFIFEQEMIFNTPIEEWPDVEALIAFYSNGLPYNKVMEYVRLRKPFMVNDLEAQSALFDRRVVYNTLREND